MSADVNVNGQRAQTVNYFQGNPAIKASSTQAPKAVASNVASNVGTPMKKPQPVAAVHQEAQPIQYQPTAAPTVDQQAPIRPEYIIAIGVVGAACMLMLMVVLIVLLMRLKRRTRTVNASVSAIDVEHQRHGHGHHRRHQGSVSGAESVYSMPAFKASVTNNSGSVIERPPAYDKD